MYTYYEYDYNGNKTFKGYVSLKNPLSVAAGAKDYYQYANISYDAMNRIKTIVDPKASINYEYDAASNRRYVKSIYHDGINGAQRVQEYWYSPRRAHSLAVRVYKNLHGWPHPKPNTANLPFGNADIGNIKFAMMWIILITWIICIATPSNMA